MSCTYVVRSAVCLKFSLMLLQQVNTFVQLCYNLCCCVEDQCCCKKRHNDKKRQQTSVPQFIKVRRVTTLLHRADFNNIRKQVSCCGAPTVNPHIRHSGSINTRISPPKISLTHKNGFSEIIMDIWDKLYARKNDRTPKGHTPLTRPKCRRRDTIKN